MAVLTVSGECFGCRMFSSKVFLALHLGSVQLVYFPMFIFLLSLYLCCSFFYSILALTMFIGEIVLETERHAYIV